MAHLFSPLLLQATRLRNRIVLASYASELSTADGGVGTPLLRHYAERAAGGAALLLSEPCYVLPPLSPTPHLGAYADSQVAGLSRLVQAATGQGAQAMLPLTFPASLHGWNQEQVARLGDAFVAAARRVHAAGACGVMLALADGEPLQQLASPRLNSRADAYGGDAEGRLRLALDVVEGIKSSCGAGFVLGLRLAVEEWQPGGITMADSRVIARRLVAAGVGLLDVTMEAAADTSLARFPGWRVPLAASLKPLLDVPVMVGGGLGEPLLADSVVRDGSVDLVALGSALRDDPQWPQAAMACIAAEQRLMDDDR